MMKEVKKHLDIIILINKKTKEIVKDWVISYNTYAWKKLLKIAVDNKKDQVSVFDKTMSEQDAFGLKQAITRYELPYISEIKLTQYRYCDEKDEAQTFKNIVNDLKKF